MKWKVVEIEVFVFSKKSCYFYVCIGVDEEVKTMPDIEKKLEQMDENPDELDWDDDEEIPEIGLNW